MPLTNNTLGNSGGVIATPPMQLGPNLTTASPFGVPADSLPFMDCMNPSLRRQILQGKDVNLATLLISNYDAPNPTLLGRTTTVCSVI
jgi:hypothetical protein